jgi:hypothetical protein
MQQTMPGDFDEPVRFFGWYTWKDLIRLGIPIGVVVWWFDLAGLPILEVAVLLLPGVIVSILWYVWRPYGEPVDVHMFHLCRWIFLGVINP